MKSTLNRREFLTRSTLAAAGLALPAALTSCLARAAAPTRARRPAPSARINLGVIGYGSIAIKYTVNFLRDPRIQVVAAADPVSELPNYGYTGEERGGRLVGQRAIERYYAENAPTGAYRGCRAYEDFREMLEREDLDAVYIATPDHWHCAITLLAARRGVHVYGQKPLSLTVGEGRRMADAVRTAGITFQTGSQQRSSIYFRTACEFVRNGRLGRLRGIKVGLPAGRDDWSGLGSRNRPETPPRELNYDLWLGPAPQRAYIPALSQVNWRNNWDYSGGMVTDWGAHHLDIVQWALDQDAGGPVAIENVTATLPPQTDIYNTATAFDFDVVYAGGLRVNVSNRHPNGILFEGEGDRSVFVSRKGLVFKPETLGREKIRPEEIRLYESRLHEENFIDCVYSGKPVAAPAETAHRSITIAHLANIAIRLGRKNLRWDPAAERVIGDEAAGRMLERPMRRPYDV